MVQMPKNLNTASEEEMHHFLESFDTVLCDCDGVLWLENEVIEGSQHVINKFIQNGKILFYVTNNNSKTREEFAEKFNRLGFLAHKENIICTSYLAAEYLRSCDFKKKVYVLGTEGILKELDRVGIRHTGNGPDVLETNLESYILKTLKLDPEIGAVLQGFDPHFSYPKIMKAATYLADPNVHFIATCPDESFPASPRLILPGTGCMLRCLEAASGRKAFILGKPNDYIKAAILRTQKIDPSRTLMIGDRCNTDILFGNKCGFKTLLVLSGVTSSADVETFANSSDPKENELVPQFCLNKLGDLFPYL